MTNAAGNLVDENGNQINGAFLANHPGFPGFGPINASQTLAYVADMQEAGVPVTNGYIADIHGNEHIRVRDALAGKIKGELEAAAFASAPVHDVLGQLIACRAVIATAQHLAAS